MTDHVTDGEPTEAIAEVPPELSAVQTFIRDRATLEALYAGPGSSWNIRRIPDDFMMICERTIGTRSWTVVGPPARCIERIDEIVSKDVKPAIVKPVTGGFMAGWGAERAG